MQTCHKCIPSSVTDGNKCGHFEYFMLLLAVKVHWNEEKHMDIRSYETEYEIKVYIVLQEMKWLILSG